MLHKLSMVIIAMLLTACASGSQVPEPQTQSPETVGQLLATQAANKSRAGTDAPAQTATDVDVVETAVTISSDTVAKNDVPSDTVRYPGASCRGLFPNAVEVSAQGYLNNLEESWFSVRDNDTYSYVDPSGSIARNGPFATWFYEMAVEDVSSAIPERFDSLEWGDNTIAWQDYLDYAQATCEAYTGAGSMRSLQIALEKFLHLRTDWSGHASHWEAFEYIDTGASIIESPSPPGLEHYTKYITGGGVIIVGGVAVPDEALLAAREAVVFMTSARPEFRDILQRNEVRISLFGPEGDTSVLPEYPDENEPGGFAMGMTDVSMTANAGWLCYPDNWDIGGNTVIHELTHTINHVVFEEINEVFFYERIYDLALDAIDKGVYMPGEQYLEGGMQADISNHMGEYWANSIEGYIMNRPGFKRSHDTRDWIVENDPQLHELITRYFPTDEWIYCPGVEEQKDLFGPDHPYSQP